MSALGTPTSPREALRRLAELRTQQDGKALKELHPEEFAILEQAVWELEFCRNESIAVRFEDMLRTAGRSPK